MDILLQCKKMLGSDKTKKPNTQKHRGYTEGHSVSRLSGMFMPDTEYFGHASNRDKCPNQFNVQDKYPGRS